MITQKIKQILIFSILISLVNCNSKEEKIPLPGEMEAKECSVCSMVISEQPSPRLQLFHHSGSNPFFCSMEDLMAYLNIPSHLGQPLVIYAEGSDQLARPEEIQTEKSIWLRAKECFFVINIDRPGVMGRPALVFSNQHDADKYAQAHNGKAFNWKELQQKYK